MTSKESFESIMKRNTCVSNSGSSRNTTYSEYLKASLTYDNLKQGFYIALKLSRHDKSVPEEQLQRYEHLVKHFDQQLMKQFKEREYTIQNILIEDDVSKNTFRDRIAKLETQGLLRNRIYFEFIDYKTDLDEAKKSFHDQNSLALKDGLITDIDHKIHTHSMNVMEKSFEEELNKIRQDHNRKREHERNDDGGSIARGKSGRRGGSIGRYQVRHIGGRGRNIRGRGRNDHAPRRISFN